MMIEIAGALPLKRELSIDLKIASLLFQGFFLRLESLDVSTPDFGDDGDAPGCFGWISGCSAVPYRFCGRGTKQV